MIASSALLAFATGLYPSDCLSGWLAARTEIHFTSARIGTLDDRSTEMTWLASAPVAIEAVLLARDQTLLFEARNQLRRIDNAACTVGTLGETYDLTGQLV